MATRKPLVLAKLIYLTVCVGALLWGRPWLAGDASIVFTVLINVATFPVGLLPTYLSGLFSSGAGSALGAFLCCTSFWWLFLFASCSTLGYLQWFTLVPATHRRFGRT